MQKKYIKFFMNFKRKGCILIRYDIGLGRKKTINRAKETSEREGMVYGNETNRDLDGWQTKQIA